MKAELAQCRSQLQTLLEQHHVLSKQIAVAPACSECSITDRAESTYQHIIGGMLGLMLGQSPAGTPYSCFKTQEAIVSALIAHHDGVMGITERTLNGKFAQARRRVRSSAS